MTTFINKYRFQLAMLPISGPKMDPTAEDYETEAHLLDAEANAEWRKGQVGNSGRLYEKARTYRRLARCKRWQEAATETAWAASEITIGRGHYFPQTMIQP